MLSKSFKMATAAGALMISTAASATYNHNCYPYYDVDADVGSYSPIVLGEDLELTACGSTVVNANNANDYFGLCSFEDWSLDYDFRLTWTVSYNGVTETIAQYGGPYTNGGSTGQGSASDGLNITVATGAGTLFSTVGNYVIGLWVDMDDNDTIWLPNNSWGETGNDGYWNPSQSGQLNIDFSDIALTVDPTAVPEPAAALLLVPGLWMIRRREQKRRQKKQSA